MLGLSQSVMKGELIPSANPRLDTYGPNLVDADASIFKQGGTYLGTDPITPRGTDTYAAKSMNAADTGASTNDNTYTNGALKWVCDTGASQVMKLQLSGTAFLSEYLVDGREYAIVLKILSDFEDDNMYVRFWDGTANTLTEDLEGSATQSDGYVWTDPADVNVWKTLGCKFTKSSFSPPYLSLSLVSGNGTTHVYVDSIYVGEKI